VNAAGLGRVPSRPVCTARGGALGRALFGPAVSLVMGDATLPAHGLYPAEQGAVRRAVEGRRREFAAGRRCAREALRALGVGPVAIPAGVDRAPRWPDGIVGSITHTSRWCLAAVAPRSVHRGLGIDAEPAEPLDDPLWPVVLTAPELHRLEGLPPGRRGLMARAVFVAKEAVYKCQYPITGRMLDFHEVEVALDAQGGRLRAEVRGRAGAAAYEGRYLVQQGLVMAGVLPADGCAPH
jgi:4'-phosphopantetheinyl transferase EntD